MIGTQLRDKPEPKANMLRRNGVDSIPVKKGVPRQTACFGLSIEASFFPQLL